MPQPASVLAHLERNAGAASDAHWKDNSASHETCLTEWADDPGLLLVSLECAENRRFGFGSGNGLGGASPDIGAPLQSKAATLAALHRILRWPFARKTVYPPGWFLLLFSPALSEMRNFLRCLPAIFCCFVALCLVGLILLLTPRVEPAVPRLAHSDLPEIVWPERRWRSINFSDEFREKTSGYIPEVANTNFGNVLIVDSSLNGREKIIVMGEHRSPDMEVSPDNPCLTFRFTPNAWRNQGGDNPYIGTDGVRIPFSDGGSFDISMTNLRTTFFEVVPTDHPNPKGTITYLTSILCLSKPEEGLLASFRELGWHTLAVLPTDSLFRFTWPLATEDREPDATEAAFLARQIDRHYAEQAFATRTALAYLSEHRPAMRKGKQILIGASAGTFTLPAVARLTEPWDAAVFIAGGTSLLEAMAENSMGIVANLENFMREPSENLSDFLQESNRSLYPSDTYRQLLRSAAPLSMLSPEKIASSLSGTPILMVAPSKENVLPPRQSENLYKKLGRPERWTYRATHGSLFYILPSQADRIDRWISRVIK